MPHRLLLLCALALFGCRTHDTGDSHIDETGDDEDCPGCFDTEAFLWSLRAGLQAGGFATVHTTTGDRVPELDLVLASPAYFDAEEPSDEHTCTLRYTVQVGPGKTAPSAWFDWALTPTLATDGCGELDPDWVAASFAADMAATPWEVVGSAPADDLLEWLQEGFSAAGNDWATQGEPYYFGGTTLLDGHDLGDDAQDVYGRAFAVDADMNILAEATGGSLLTTAAIAAGSDGYFELYGWVFYNPRQDLP
jgi:hypothetical protein